MPTVLLTRPEGENESLASMLEAAGCSTLVRPLIQLLGIDMSPDNRALIQNLDQIDLIVFVSKAAVQFGLPWLDSFWPAWPTALKWFAVGPGTAALLANQDIKALAPESPGSEGLLALNELQEIAGQNVLIVRGVGGRELLADKLREGGASVSYLEAYSREGVTHADLDQVAKNCVVTLTSIQIMEEFVAQVHGQVQHSTAVVASARIADAARAAGFKRVEIAGGASDQALYDAVLPLITDVE